MPRPSPYVITLSSAERRALQERVAQYTLPYRDVVRAKIVLFAAQGLENTVIGQRLDLPRPVVSKWRQRFCRHRLAGLDDLPRRGRPAVFSPSARGPGEGAGL